MDETAEPLRRLLTRTPLVAIGGIAILLVGLGVIGAAVAPLGAVSDVGGAIGLAIALVASAIAVWFARSVLARRVPGADVGLDPRRVTFGLLGGAVPGAALIGASFAVAALSGALVVQRWAGTEHARLVVPVLAVALLAAVAEELALRGILLPAVGTRAGWPAGLAVSVAASVLLHAVVGDSVPVGVASGVAVGLPCGLLALVTRDVWAPIGFHLALEVTARTLVAGPGAPGGFEVSAVGPDWLVGAPGRVDGSAIAALLAVAGSAAIVAALRRRPR